MSYHDTQWAESEMKRARSKDAGRPLQNNTRLYDRGDGKYAVKLHAVDVVTINPDGTYTLRAGGWHTVTTLDRIRGYSPAKLFSISGDWYVQLESNPKDPQPARYNRTVPKPYEATDPGPEPVKNPEGCVAGQLVTTEHVNEIVEIYRRNMKDGDELVEVTRESTISGSDYDDVKVRRSWNDHVWIGEAAQSYQDESWAEFTGAQRWQNINTHYINDDEPVKYVQCSHCQEFDAEHGRWYYQMHGKRWGVRFDQQTGYATYAEMMAQFGSMEAWHEAYIADFRARRDYLKAHREWDERNRVPFYDGITVNADGYVPRLRKGGPSPAKLRRHEREVAKVKKQIATYVNGYIAELQKGTMRMPSGGDCWYCSMRTEDGVPLGDAMNTLHSDGSMTVEQTSDHLWSHMEEPYYVPSLAANALLERGYRPEGVYIWLDMNQDNDTMGRPNGRYDNVKRDLIKYMSKRLVPQAPKE